LARIHPQNPQRQSKQGDNLQRSLPLAATALSLRHMTLESRNARALVCADGVQRRGARREMVKNPRRRLQIGVVNGIRVRVRLS
jgi:hypothetical protein